MTEPQINRARGSNSGKAKKLPTLQAKERVIQAIKDGLQVEDAMSLVDRTRHTYIEWRRTDESFKRSIDQLREMASAARRRKGEDAIVPDFPEFSATYLGHEVPIVHMRTWDLMNGREPRELHPAMRYNRGRPNMLLINYPPDHGKHFSLSTTLPTPFGWTTMGDVQVGDEVLGRDGCPAVVIDKSEVILDRTFRVVFASGAELIAGKDHRWLVRGRGGRTGVGRGIGPKPRVRNGVYAKKTAEVVKTTLELFELGVTEGKAGRPVWAVPVAEPLQLPAADLPIDPYVLGAWLGDGTSAGGGFTGIDPEITDHIAAAGYEVTHGPNAKSHYIKGIVGQLRQVGVLNNKHIPAAYMRASHEQRLALLQGLMDTDGTCNTGGQASFSQTREGLARQVHELVRTLGIKARFYKGPAMLNGIEVGTHYRVSFQPGATPAFRLGRKLARQKPTNPRAKWDYITEITEVDPVPSQCISVDNADHLYLAGEQFTVTHNSTTWSVNYATWRIISDKNSRGAIISKTSNLANQFLGAIKNRLTNPRYAELQKAFAPEGGFQGESWTQRAIYVGGRDSGEKDPTVQTLGIGGQLYGARLDWVILDDVVDNSNAHRYEEQLQWLTTEVISRLPDDGLIMVLGTRIQPVDLYKKLREMMDYNDINPLWTYMAQPAVLDGAADSPEGWTTLWPERWPGPALARRKATLGSASRWALVFQQQDVSDEAIFPVAAVEASINKARAAGALTGGLHGDAGLPDVKPEHLYIVAGLDPATVGKTAMVVMGLDRLTQKRIVLDAFNMANCPPQKMREQVKYFTTKYGVKEWVIERNAFQRYLTQDEELRTFLYGQGCILREHFTSTNKYDEDFGVMSMAPLFLSCLDPAPGDPFRRKSGGGLIDLPNRQFSTWTDEMVEQLIVWQPNQNKRSVLTDLVMALWFCEIACKRQIEGARSAPTHHDNPFLPRREQGRRVTVRLDELAQQAFEAKAFRATRGY